MNNGCVCASVCAPAPKKTARPSPWTCLVALAALGCWPSGCLAPLPDPLPEPGAQAVQGRWEAEGDGDWTHRDAGEGILLLPGSGERRLLVRLFPGETCRELGILAGYRAPDRTQGVRIRTGPEPRLEGFRREGAMLLEPPSVSASLPGTALAGGVLLEVTAWPGVLSGRLPESGPGVLWHGPAAPCGRMALFARGPARFQVVSAQEHRQPPPPATADGLLACLPVRRAPAKHLGAHLAAALEALDGEQAPPQELVAAWHWTGRGAYRDRAQAWAGRAAALPGSAELLEGLLAAGHLLGPSGEDALERCAAAAANALDTEDPPLDPADGAASRAWIQAARALRQAQGRLQGALRERAHQAQRNALNRLVRALQPGPDGFGAAGTWETEQLLAAAEWLWEARSQRADAGRLLVSIGLFLEERRLARTEAGLQLLDRALRPRPDLDLCFALFLARRGELAGDPASLAAAEALALAAAPGGGSFRTARDLAVAVPRLAPPATLALVATTGRVLSIQREAGLLAWTTQGPSTETILAPGPDLVLVADGRSRPARGPRIVVTHAEGRARLFRELPAREAPAPGR